MKNGRRCTEKSKYIDMGMRFICIRSKLRKVRFMGEKREIEVARCSLLVARCTLHVSGSRWHVARCTKAVQQKSGWGWQIMKSCSKGS